MAPGGARGEYRDMVRSHPTTTDASAQSPLQLLIVDDRGAVREGLRRLISTETCPWGTIRSAGTLAEARQCLQGWWPDVVVLDVDLGGDDGLALLPELSGRARVLVLTSHADGVTRERAARMGAAALLDKNEPAAHVLAQVRQLMAPHLRGDKAPVRVGT